MKKILPIIEIWLLCLLVICLSSCGTQRQIKKCKKCFSLLDSTTLIKDSIHITFDTLTHVIEIPADTSIQVIVIECDSTGKASIKSSTTVNGKRSTINTTFNNNILNIQATCKEYIDSLQIVNKEVNRLRSETNTVFVPQLIEKKLTWWQKIKIRFGGWAFLLIAIYGTYKGAKTYYKVNSPMGLILLIRRKLMR